MVQLKTNAASAVAAFFGHDESNSNVNPSGIAVLLTDHEATGTEQTLSHGKGVNRKLGVGAAAPKVDVIDKAMDNVAKLLKIGKNRKRGSHEEEEDVDGITGQSESSDDEEDGRTAVGKSKCVSKTDIIDVQLKKKKSKKQKKDNNSGSESSQITKDEYKHDDKCSGISANPHQTERLECLEAYRKQRLMSSSGPGSSGKRSKVRSKQKNIRKDTRGYKKPRHLIPGDSEFTGRGLTAATRAYLGLPEKQNVVAIRHSSSASKGGNYPSTNSNSCLSDLAVDSLLADVGQFEARDENKETLGNTSKMSMEKKQRSQREGDKDRKKSKRPKYKNLRIPN